MQSLVLLAFFQKLSRKTLFFGGGSARPPCKGRVKKDSGILKLFEGNFYQDIKLHIIYFSLTDINVGTVIISSSIYLPLHAHLRVRLMNLVTSSFNFTTEITSPVS